MKRRSITQEIINPTIQHAMKCPKLYGQDCQCDGYHTFDELYAHRVELFITLCRNIKKTKSWKSKKHSDGTQWKDWFIMGIETAPGRQITYHIPIAKWKETNFVISMPRAPKFDGHTSNDVLKRLKNL